MDTSKVKVMVRCRPLLPRENVGMNGQRATSSLRVTHDHKQVTIGDGKVYTFDNIYDEKSGQEDIFKSCVEPLVEGCFNGYNATVLAYGQTGSGKTYTMGSAPSKNGDPASEGIIPRAVKHIFNLIQTDHVNKIINLRVSFLEIYNEEIRDLLHPDVSSRDIVLREDNEGRIFFTGAREEVCSSAMDVFRCLERGAVGRTTAETWMNDASSRSHAIFTISIDACDVVVPNELRGTDASGSGGKYIQSKLHLVDLAGSERAKKTGAVGLRLKESVGINQGLMSLGKVIRALTTPHKAGGGGSSGLLMNAGTATHVPYRESKLTRFLQDSLGGNSQTVMLACVTPSDTSLHETLSTLQYAARARMVQNKVVANVSTAPPPELEEGLVVALRSQLIQVQQELENARKNADVAGLMLHMRRSLDESGLLDRSMDKDKSATLRNANWQLVAALVEGIRDVEQRLGSFILEVETFVAAGSNDYELAMQQLEEATRVGHLCLSQLNGLHDTDAASRVITNARERLASEIKKTQNPKQRGDGENTEVLAEKDLQIMRLKSELEECKEDLRRDEEIFAEKIKELKKNKKEVKKLTTENVSLKMALAAAQDALKVEMERVTLQSNMNKPTANSKGVDCDEVRDSLDKKGVDATEEEISFAVAACEPDLSQLMEDLEVLSKEKDDLLLEKLEAEKRVKEVAMLAEAEKHQHHQAKEVLQRRMKELEIGMKLKQEVISSLARKQQEAAELAEKYETKVNELQELTGRLTEQLKNYSNQTPERPSRARVSDMAEAKSPSSSKKERQNALRKSEQEDKKSYYEEQLQLAKDQLSELQHRQHLEASVQSPSRSSSARRQRPVSTDGKMNPEHNSAQLRQELDLMRHEYSDLVKQVELEEAKQKAQMEKLEAQVELYQKNAAEYQRKIKKLEKINLQYHQNMDANQLRVLQDRQHALLTGERPSSTGDHAGYLRRFRGTTAGSGSHTPNNARHPTPTRGMQSSSTLESDKVGLRPTSAPISESIGTKMTVSGSPQWLEKKIDEVVQMKFKRVEVSDFKERLHELKSDRSAMTKELEILKKQQADGAISINRQLKEVENKIISLNAQISSDREGLERECTTDSARRSIQSDEEERAELELRILTHISESQRAVRSYQERQRELKMRLDNGVLNESSLSKMASIQDDLESLQAEIQFIEHRITGTNDNVSDNNKNPWNTPSKKVTDKRCLISDDDVRKAKNALLAELQRIDESSAIRFLLYLTPELIEAKFRAIKEEMSALQCKTQLDEVTSEKDKLSEALKISNLEFAAKIDAQKIDNENKISFLVQQLRSAEDRLKLSSNRQGTSIMTRESSTFGLSDAFEAGNTESRVSRPSTATASAVWATMTGKRPQSGDTKKSGNNQSPTGSSTSEISRRMAGYLGSSSVENDPLARSNDIYVSKTNIQRSAAAPVVEVESARPEVQQTGMVTPGGPLSSTDEELKRRWFAEKQRREQLEKRNMELTRELRNLKKAS